MYPRLGTRTSIVTNMFCYDEYHILCNPTRNKSMSMEQLADKILTLTKQRRYKVQPTS